MNCPTSTLLKFLNTQMNFFSRLRERSILSNEIYTAAEHIIEVFKNLGFSPKKEILDVYVPLGNDMLRVRSYNITTTLKGKEGNREK